MLSASSRVGSVEVRDTDPARLQQLAGSFGDSVVMGHGSTVPDSTDLVVVATAAGTQAALSRRAVRASAAVVTTSNEIIETRDWEAEIR